LEEVDEIFENKISAIKAGSYKSAGVGGQITKAEGTAVVNNPETDSSFESDLNQKV
jgi:hypothetical protein